MLVKHVIEWFFVQGDLTLSMIDLDLVESTSYDQRICFRESSVANERVRCVGHSKG